MEKIHENLNVTVDILRGSLVKLSHRGTQINDIAQVSERLLASSDLFVIRTLPWYSRWWRALCVCPAWWFSARQTTLVEEPHQPLWVMV